MEVKVKEIETKLAAKDQEIRILKEEKEQLRKIVRQEVRKRTEEKDQVIKNLQLKIDKLSRDNAKLEDETKIKDERISSLQLSNMNMDVVIKRMQGNDVTEREERRQKEIEERREILRKLGERRDNLEIQKRDYEEFMKEQKEKLEELESLEEDNDEENNEMGGNRVTNSQSRKRPPARPSNGDNSNGVLSPAKLPRQCAVQ